MRVFIDTEFTDFVNPDLISIALVTDDGRHFYAERSDFDRGRCSAFVKQVVLPQIGKQPGHEMTLPELRVRLATWMREILAGGDQIAVCYDYFLDRDLLLGLLSIDKQWSVLSFQDVWAQIDDLAKERFFMETGLADHHALNDALANRFAFNATSDVTDELQNDQNSQK